MRNRITILLFCLLLLSVGANVVILHKQTTTSKNAQLPEAEEKVQFPYLAKRIFVEKPNDIIINFTELRDQVAEYRKDKKAEIGMHFQYLPSGVTVSLDADKPFFAASLLKLPVAMQVYKEIEKGTVRRDQLLTIKSHHIDAAFGDLWKKGVGSQISVSEALNLSLQDSDNTANLLLLDLIPGKRLSEVLNYLDIPQEIETGQLLITPRGFSSVLRSLYFSAYLSYPLSNELLSILIEGNHRLDHLKKVLPEHIQVANKSGVYALSPETIETHLYSECGIVYVPARQYVLCVFVKGNNEEYAGNVISDISNITYQYVISRP